MKTILLIALSLMFAQCIAQSPGSLQQLPENDSSTIHLVFSYPEAIRENVFLAATYPQGFTRLEEIQKESAAAFKNVAAKFNQRKQKKLWDIARFPELLPLLIANKDKSNEELLALMKNYPLDTKNAAVEFVKKDYDAIVSTNNIRLQFETKYKSVFKDFPSDIQEAYQQLLQHPELISVLSQDLKSTVKIGDWYKNNPVLLKHIADSVNAKITSENGAEYSEWKRSISNDSLAQKELKTISKKYREENYPDDVYANHENLDTVIYNAAPYPYWSGYPYWYTTPYWYPYPWWYQAGFYWNPYDRLIFYGMPSYHFGLWYYNHPYYNRHRRSSQLFNNYYQNRPRQFGDFNNRWNRRSESRRRR